MLVEAVVWGGSTLIGGLGVGYYFLSKFDSKVKSNLNDCVSIDATVKNTAEKTNSLKNNKEDAKEIQIRNQLYLFVKLCIKYKYFDYEKYTPPDKVDYSSRKSILESVDKTRKYREAIENASPLDIVLIDFYNREVNELHKTKSLESLIMKYSYTWDTYEDILKEAEKYKTPLSKEVREEVFKGLTNFLSDYTELEYRDSKRKKDLQDSLNKVTNESFMQRLQLEREYINKVRNKEEFDLTLNNI